MRYLNKDLGNSLFSILNTSGILKRRTEILPQTVKALTEVGLGSNELLFFFFLFCFSFFFLQLKTIFNILGITALMKHNLFDPYTAPLGLLLADSQL